MDKTIQLVVEAISELYNIEIPKAKSIVSESFFPEIFHQMPDFVYHYDAEYWAREIMSDKEIIQ